MKTELAVQHAAGPAEVPADSEFQAWADVVLAERDPVAALTIRIVAEDESRRLNREYRDKDRPTNVLSFPAGLPGDIVAALRERGAAVPLGDLVICAGVVEREAAAQGKPERQHWAHLVIHGILHLLGHDHDSAAQAREMEDLERGLLAGLGIPDPYLAR